ncbi:hypothetical protein [Nocardia brevicatena]|uniref:hypothetical protein n=1 Tax=Nocardia brevicatena TaxID=37327 RepID=UPI0002D6F7F5|nr:hypothetical protein [Nocardia brevicatena]
MANDRPKAIGFVNKRVDGYGADIGRVAEGAGYRLVWTVNVDVSTLPAAPILASAVMEHDAQAVVVPSFEHIDPLRHLITDIAALVTPMYHCPRGYRWPMIDLERPCSRPGGWP